MTRSARLARHAAAAEHVAAVHAEVLQDWSDVDGLVDVDEPVDVAALVPRQRGPSLVASRPDLARLGRLERSVEWLQAEQLRIVDEARAGGCTWDEIGAALGLSRQRAHQRYGPSSAARVGR